MKVNKKTVFTVLGMIFTVAAGFASDAKNTVITQEMVDEAVNKRLGVKNNEEEDSDGCSD